MVCSTILKKRLELPCELTNPLTGEATFGTVEDRIALALIGKMSREDLPVFKGIFDPAFGRTRAVKAKFDTWAGKL